jgi:two-component system chemotaxis response regulator CheB
MWRMNGEGPLRFRCHVGHAYTAEAMDVGQAESLESNLWEVLRTLEERTALLRELAERARELNELHEASTWESRIGGLQRDMVALRDLLAKGTSKSPSAPEPSLGS